MDGDDTEQVIKKIQTNGTFDDIRHKVVDALKKNEGLRSMVFDMVENSQALATADSKKLNNHRALLDLIRKELETELMEQASKAAWEVMCSPDSEVATFIDEKVHEALCTVHQERRSHTATSTSYATASHAQAMQAHLQPPIGQLQAGMPSEAAAYGAQYQGAQGYGAYGSYDGAAQQHYGSGQPRQDPYNHQAYDYSQQAAHMGYMGQHPVQPQQPPPAYHLAAQPASRPKH